MVSLERLQAGSGLIELRCGSHSERCENSAAMPWIGARMSNLTPAVSKHKDKLSRIRVFLTDCDNVLTDGKIYWFGQEVGWNRCFQVQDGYALKFLRKLGFKVGIISGVKSDGLEQRCRDLKVDFAMLGDEDKRAAWDEVKSRAGCTDEEMLYIGDEIFDLPLLRRAGFSATVPGACNEVLEAVDYVTTRSAGEGAVREVADLLRHSQGLSIDIPDFQDASVSDRS